MWPWGHAAVGYLLYSGVLSVRGCTSEELPVLALGVATVLPDLIDKPLALWLGVLPEGRSLAHSLLFAVPLFVLVWLLIRDRCPETSVAFMLGYLSHLVADGWRAILSLDASQLTYLVWPLLPLPDYPKDSLGLHIATLAESVVELNPEVALHEPMGPATGQMVLFVIAAALWVRHGRPGLRILVTGMLKLGRWLAGALMAP
jgi:hypothetical protein